MKRRERYLTQQWATAERCDVFMRFERQDQGWRVSFRKPLAHAILPRVLKFADSAKITNLYERFGSRRLAEDRAAFEFAIQQGQGVVELSLGREQYGKLLSRSPQR